MWSAFCTGGAGVRIKNSSKHIVISHLATLISTAMRSHCSTELARFPEEFSRSRSLSSLFSSLPVPPTSSSFQPLSSPNSLSFSSAPLLMPLDLPPSPVFSIELPFPPDQSSRLPLCLLPSSPCTLPSFTDTSTPSCSCPFSLSLFPFLFRLSFLFLYPPGGAGY